MKHNTQVKAIALGIGLVSAAALSGLALSSVKPAKTTINPPNLMDSLQYGYSQATSIGPDVRTVFISGQAGVSEAGPNDFHAQVDRAFDNLAAMLRIAGADVDDVVKISLLVKDHDPEKMDYLIAKRRAFFGNQPPASTLIPVPTLALDRLAFEVDAIAMVRTR